MTLPAPLAMLLILGGALIPGVLALSLWGRRFDGDALDFTFAGLSIGLLAFGWLALILAEIGRFSISALGLVWVVTVLALVSVRFSSRRRAGNWPHLVLDRRECAVLVVWALAASWLFFRPHEFVIGGADAGVYVNLGANIAREGSILIQDETVAGLDPALVPALLRAMPPGEAAPYYLLPGFYITGAPSGLVTPQFYPLHPVWQAIGYALGGVRVALLLTPLWAWLGCLAVYMTVRRLWGRKIGLLALAGLTMTALQVWFARYPTSEMLTQYLLWTAMWTWIAWADGRQPRGLWAALSGVALGQVLLTRIDSYVLLLLPLLAGLWLLGTRRGRRADFWLFGCVALLTVHSLAHGMLESAPYFFQQFRYGSGVVARSRALPLGLALLAGAGLAVMVTWALRPGWRHRSIVLALRLRQWLVIAAAVLLALLALYAYFLRPYLGQATVSAYWYGGGQIFQWDHENFVRLGWYLGPLGLALSVAGACWILVKECNRRTVFLLGAGLFFSLFYLWRIQANPHQVYAMRRYVPIVLPFFVVSAAFLLGRLLTARRTWVRWLSAGLTLIWMLGILSSACGFVSQVDYRGVIAQLDRLNTDLVPRSVLIFNDVAPVGAGDMVGTPLRFLYGHDVFTVRDPKALDPGRFAQAVRRWQADGRTVYWASVPGGSPWPGGMNELNTPRSYEIDSTVLENTYEHKPSALSEVRWHLDIAPVR